MNTLNMISAALKRPKPTVALRFTTLSTVVLPLKAGVMMSTDFVYRGIPYTK